MGEQRPEAPSLWLAQITRDHEGLAYAKALLVVVQATVQQLEGEKGLPAAVKPKTVVNPFE